MNNNLKSVFLTVLSENQVLTSPQDLEKYGRDWIKDYKPNASLILMPNTYEQVQSILTICFEKNIKVVPSGGRTGLSGGATALNAEVILSLEKLNKIIEFNEIEQTITCQAGAVTQLIQEKAEEKSLYFPIDFSSKGTSQIGGNIATNAGGIRVVRYGNIRNWVLGLKIVTADGQLVELNGSLIKNQTGYDLKNLIIGSEGTLAVIVEATLRLSNIPENPRHIICGSPSITSILQTFKSARKIFSTLSVFEYFSRDALEEVLCKHSLKDPLMEKCAHYALIEIEDCSEQSTALIENFLSMEIDSGNISDAVLSQNTSQSNQFITYRELIPEVLNSNYTLHKNDISVPISKIDVFISDLQDLIKKLYPEFKAVVFGHIGDGNLHINILKPRNMETNEFYRHCKVSDFEIFKLIQKNNGSISAEHGVGLLKKEFLNFSRSSTEINLMRQIKKVFDPKSILNPGKIFD